MSALHNGGPSYLQLVFVGYGRTRLRLPWLSETPSEATGLADSLRELPGMHEVEVRPYTGSVLCLHDPERLDAETILRRVQELTHVANVWRPGEPPPPVLLERARTAHAEGSELARAIATFWKGVDADFLVLTEGRISLPTTLSTAFLLGGIVEVLGSTELPLPRWHELIWWSLRSFSWFEQNSVEHTEHPLASAR